MEEIGEKVERFSTSDFSMATHCLLEGLNIIGKDPKSLRNNKTIVHFEGPNANKIAHGFFKSKTKEVMDAYRTIKDYAYTEKQETEHN